MSDLHRFAEAYGVSHDAVCERLYCRHADSIRVRKPRVAVPRLAAIIAAALHLGNGEGFHSMSMRSLARECGLSMGALYNYIEDKQGLLRLILDGVADAVDRTLVRAPVPQGEDAARRLLTLIRRHVLLSECLQPWFAFVYMEAKAFDHDARQFAIREEQKTEALFRETLSAGASQGVFRCPQPRVTAALIKPLLQDWYIKRWKYRGLQIDPEDYALAVYGFIGSSLGVPVERLASRDGPEAASVP